MKKVMDILTVAVGFLLTAAIIILSVTYFNRGKEVVTENAEGILSIVEGAGANMERSMESYDEKVVKGSVVISMIESLSSSQTSVPILVYTNGGATVSEYTKFGATADLKIGSLSEGVYETATPTPKIADVTEGSGAYKQKSNDAYINPTQTYSVQCHYTENGALVFVTITHKK